jgi:hypothetical protein
MTEVVFKTQSFINFYALHVVSSSVDNDDNPGLLPSVFTNDCICGFIQLILGRPHTNEGFEMPIDRASVFEGCAKAFLVLRMRCELRSEVETLQ